MLKFKVTGEEMSLKWSVRPRVRALLARSEWQVS